MTSLSNEASDTCLISSLAMRWSCGEVKMIPDISGRRTHFTRAIGCKHRSLSWAERNPCCRLARLAAAVGEWVAGAGLAARDAIVLLPFAQHIGPAQRAFAQQPGWAPQLTTSRSLASSDGPSLLAAPGQISLDAAMDAFTADALLAGQSWAQTLREHSDAAYLAARAQMVETAHLLARGARNARRRSGPPGSSRCASVCRPAAGR